MQITGTATPRLPLPLLIVCSGMLLITSQTFFLIDMQRFMLHLLSAGCHNLPVAPNCPGHWEAMPVAHCAESHIVA
jgi:hypothetical protein